MKISRRRFLQAGAASVAAASMSQSLFARAMGSGGPTDRILVFLRLDGGYDGLNTIVPYGFERNQANHYYTWRPPTANGLGIPENDVLALDAEFGFHPAFAELHSLWQANKFAVVHGVGYPGADRSHFRSGDIWQSGSPSLPAYGVGGRHLDGPYDPGDGIVRGVDLTGGVTRIMRAQRANVLSGRRARDFRMPRDSSFSRDALNRSQALASLYGGQATPGSIQAFLESTGRTMIDNADAFVQAEDGYEYQGVETTLSYESLRAEGNYLADRFELISQILTSSTVPTKPQIFNVSIGGFDTHAKQGWVIPDEGQPRQLQRISRAVMAFYNDMAARGMSDQVVFVTLSEFGRRVEANGSRGTDHGAAAPMMVFGDCVNGGLYGVPPSLQPNALDSRGDLVYTTDFRSVYASIIRDWIQGDDVSVLGSDWYDPSLSLIQTT